MNALDAMVKATTAFDTVAEFFKVMDESGYVPTIYATTRRKCLLIKFLKANGYRVWGNNGKNW